MTSAFCTGLIFACAVRALARRDAVSVDDGLSMMQVNHKLFRESFEHQARAPFEGPPLHLLLSMDTCSTYNFYEVQTIDECTAAAAGLAGFGDLGVAASDGLVGASDRPPYCYMQMPEQHLMFNDGSNTGPCDYLHGCVCAVNPPAAAPPTSAPTSAATSVPTSAPTPGPNAGSAPTSAPTQGAVATGDPHVTNVDFERFDILRSGVFEFLRLPRRAKQSPGSEEPEPLLSVLAAVERVSEDECHATYVKQVNVTGSWLNSSGPLRFRADGDSLESARAIVLWVNGSLMNAHSLGRDSRLGPFLKATEPGISRDKNLSTTFHKVPLFTVELSFAAATLKIDWVHRATPGRPPLNHLNFQALGLRRFLDGAGADIGGILGRDDHSDAASLPDDCKPALEDLRSSGKQEDLQVVAAAL